MAREGQSRANLSETSGSTDIYFKHSKVHDLYELTDTATIPVNCFLFPRINLTTSHSVNVLMEVTKNREYLV